ncbi:PIR protein, putative [Plasmodium sp. gorilla clade G1]|nr:PIR protein, putative [Plasmodium sp. gorilla clade G1]
MKVHCYNILLFSLPLNILLLSSSEVNTQVNHYNTPHIKNTEPKKSYRSLCECDLYTSFYHDPEMKKIMQDFDRQTSQRFEEYNERIIKNRQKYKEQYDRDIQKIILKDKISKELKQQLTTLETNIDINNIPTCVCEKSVTDKVGKTCLKCGYGLGSNVPLLGLINGIGVYTAAKSSAVKIGVSKAMELIKGISGINELAGFDVTKIVTPANYCNRQALVTAIQELNIKMCVGDVKETNLFCFIAEHSSPYVHRYAADAALKGGEAASGKFAEMTSVGVIFSDPVIISAIVVVCIVVILLIIYLILRYRRKKQMNKKLQYIKLLKE